MPQPAEKKPVNRATCPHCGRPFHMSHLRSGVPPPSGGLRHRVMERLSLSTAEAFRVSEKSREIPLNGPLAG